MALHKAVTGIMDTLHTIGTKVAGPIGGHALRVAGKTGFKVGGKVLDAAAGVANTAIKEIPGKINKESIGKAVNKTITNTMTDDSAYRQLGKLNIKGSPIMVANKSLFADDMERRVKTLGDHMGNAYSMATKEGPFQLLKKSDESLIGLKATGLGVAVAGAAMAASGTPDAVKEWNRGRQGYNQDMMPTTSAPQIPAYAQNGGATGDLVFALNNLRHGGMM